MRLAIVTTHPIQYHAPVFRELAQRETIQLRVFYGWQGTVNSVDVGFGQHVEWDIPLLQGYDSEFLENVASEPGSFSFRGIDTPSLINRVTDWQADAILIYGWCYKSHLAAMRHFHGKIPVCFRGDSTLLNEIGGIRRVLRRTLLRWVYSHVDMAFSVGTHNHIYFRRHGLDEHRIIHAPHAVDNTRFASPEARTEGMRLRHSLGLTETDIVVLFPGKLEPIKQPQELLKAVRRLSDHKVNLVFAGSGPLEESLRSVNAPRTQFLGFQNQSQMPSVYHMADVVCLPSKSETWGLVLNEAMACSRPIIASDTVGAAADLIEPHRNGWVFRSSDPESLVQALVQAVAMKREGLREFGRHSARIIDNWSIPQQATAIVNGLRHVIYRTEVTDRIAA